MTMWTPRPCRSGRTPVVDLPAFATSLSVAIAAALASPAALATVPAMHATTGLSLIPEQAAADDGGQELYLEVSINHDTSGRLARFVIRDGSMSASAATLRELGLRWPGSDQAQGLLDLQAIPGLEVQYDAAHQRVLMLAPVAMLSSEPTRIGPPRATVAHPTPSSRAPGLILNYDLYGQSGEDYRTLSGLTELRLFGAGPGVWSSTFSNRLNGGDAAFEGRHDSVRLDTFWQFDLPAPMLSLSAGDTITGALDWTRPTRIGGLRLARNFSLQPYRTIAPLASFTGEAALPSTVDLYINGLKQASHEVRPGRFQIDSIPSLNGLGQAQMVVTDINGQSRTVSFPLYGTPDLLQQGLSDWSVELGMLRKDYGLRSFAYGRQPMASATARYGLTDAITLEGHAEANGDVRQAGAGATWRLGQHGGVLSTSLAGSLGRQGSGHQHGLAYQWNSPRFNAALRTLRRSEDYQDVASQAGSLLARRTDQAYAGLNSPLGQWGASYTLQTRALAGRSRYATFNWSRSLARNSTISISVNRDLENRNGDSAFLFWSLPLDRHTSVSTSARSSHRSNNLTLEANRALPGDLGGWGWRAQATVGDSRRGQAQVSHLGQHGQWALGADHNRGTLGSDATTTVYASAAGGLVWMQGRINPMRRVEDAFALVTTNGVAGVPVRLENRLVGYTDSHGQLMINRLNAWQHNQIAIDILDLPADMQVDTTRIDAVPASRSGMLARFPMRRVVSVQLAVVDSTGQWLPAGSRAWLETPAGGAPQATTVVGHDGLVHLVAPPANATLHIQGRQHDCRVQLPASTIPEQRDPTGRQDLGTLECR